MGRMGVDEVNQVLSVGIVAGLLVLTCLGCARQQGDTQAVWLVDEGTGAATRVDTPATEARLNRVGFLDPYLNRRIAVQRTGAKRSPTGTLEVWAVFRNRTRSPQSIQVRTQFFGPVREPNEGPYAWQNIFLPANGIQTYRTYSRGTGDAPAEYYYIEVQEIRP